MLRILPAAGMSETLRQLLIQRMHTRFDVALNLQRQSAYWFVLVVLSWEGTYWASPIARIRFVGDEESLLRTQCSRRGANLM
jgi:hypothetical protein